MVSFLLFPACKMPSWKEGFHIFTECLASWCPMTVQLLLQAIPFHSIMTPTWLGWGWGAMGKENASSGSQWFCMNVRKSFTWELNWSSAETYPNNFNGNNSCMLFPSFPPLCFALTVREMLATGSNRLDFAVGNMSWLHSANLTVYEWKKGLQRTSQVT